MICVTTTKMVISVLIVISKFWPCILYLAPYEVLILEKIKWKVSSYVERGSNLHPIFCFHSPISSIENRIRKNIVKFILTDLRKRSWYFVELLYFGKFERKKRKKIYYKRKLKQTILTSLEYSHFHIICTFAASRQACISQKVWSS